MKTPLIGIKIENRQAAHSPGERLRGEYQIDAVESAEVRAIELAVLWYTEGKGDEDLGIHHFERHTDEDNGAAPLTELRRFEVVLPNTPQTYDGVLVKIRWCVRVRVFLRSGKEYVAELPFRLGDVPPARAVLPPRQPAAVGAADETQANGESSDGAAHE